MSRPSYPPDHRPGLRVPKGGSSCSNCAYYGPAEGSAHGVCGSPDYQRYYGTSEIPAPADEYCSDWYEPGRQ